MEEVIARRLIEAALRAEADSGWSITVRYAGIVINYKWQHITFHPFTNRPMLGNHYTVESTTGWRAIGSPRGNPLLTAMDDLISQAAKFEP
jgi:hypothetical protein